MSTDLQSTPRGRFGGSEHEASHPSDPRLGMGVCHSGGARAGEQPARAFNERRRQVSHFGVEHLDGLSPLALMVLARLYFLASPAGEVWQLKPFADLNHREIGRALAELDGFDLIEVRRAPNAAGLRKSRLITLNHWVRPHHEAA